MKSGPRQEGIINICSDSRATIMAVNDEKKHFKLILEFITNAGSNRWPRVYSRTNKTGSIRNTGCSKNYTLTQSRPWESPKSFFLKFSFVIFFCFTILLMYRFNVFHLLLFDFPSHQYLSSSICLLASWRRKRLWDNHIRKGSSSLTILSKQIRLIFHYSHSHWNCNI